MATPVVMPQMGESIAEGTIVRWIKKVGEPVDRDEPLFEISTDKVDAEIPSPAAGMLTEIKVKEGETVAVNSVVATIGARRAKRRSRQRPPSRRRRRAAPADGGRQPRRRRRSRATAGCRSVALRRHAARTGHVVDRSRRSVEERPPPESSPLVRRIAKEHNVDIAQICRAPASAAASPSTTSSSYIDSPAAPAARAGERDAASASARRRAATGRSRRAIASRPALGDAQEDRRAHGPEPAHVGARVLGLSTSTSRTVAQLRQAEEGGIRSGRREAHVHGVHRQGDRRRAAPSIPIVNASIDGDNVVYKNDINLGIAVALDDGLDRAGHQERRREEHPRSEPRHRRRRRSRAREAAQAGRSARRHVHHHQPRQFGAQFGMPIINQPQVAILGVGTIEKRPVVIDDAIAIRTMAYLTLGYDHRLVDGAVADQFMADVKQRLENFDADDC